MDVLFYIFYSATSSDHAKKEVVYVVVDLYNYLVNLYI